uniref:hypothetical protein n=1 Tax=Bifidobacterium adolescentis TaxID=1680 RepID=UPI004025016D
MTNLLYALTDHDHTENELTPWLAECATGDGMADGLILTALDCAWGHWEYAAGSPIHSYADPEYLKAAEESLWRWDDVFRCSYTLSSVWACCFGSVME